MTEFGQVSIHQLVSYESFTCINALYKTEDAIPKGIWRRKQPEDSMYVA